MDTLAHTCIPHAHTRSLDTEDSWLWALLPCHSEGQLGEGLEEGRVEGWAVTSWVPSSDPWQFKFSLFKFTSSAKSTPKR